MLKFLIIGENSINKKKLLDILVQNKKFKVAKTFITNKSLIKDQYYYLISNEDLNICYKNNAILFVKTILSDSYGITLDSFYENNIICMNTEDFNNISNKIFLSNNELIIIVLDTKNHDIATIKKEINESNYLWQKINTDNLKYMYFLDVNFKEVADILNDYLLNEDHRDELLENYS